MHNHISHAADIKHLRHCETRPIQSEGIHENEEINEIYLKQQFTRGTYDMNISIYGIKLNVFYWYRSIQMGLLILILHIHIHFLSTGIHKHYAAVMWMVWVQDITAFKMTQITEVELRTCKYIISKEPVRSKGSLVHAQWFNPVHGTCSMSQLLGSIMRSCMHLLPVCTSWKKMIFRTRIRHFLSCSVESLAKNMD